MKSDFPHADPKLLLKIYVNVMNDTIDENGLVLSHLVVGIIPTMPILSKNLPKKKERMEVMEKA